MKFLNLTIPALIGLAAASAPTQPYAIPVAYDTYGGALSVNYYTGPGCTCAGDAISLVGLPPVVAPSGAPPMYTMGPADTWDTLSILFIPLKTGTINMSIGYLSGYSFGVTNINCPTWNFPITIPPGGGSSVWEVTLCFGATQIGNNLQVFNTHGNNADFSPAYVNQAAVPVGSDIPFNWFIVDFITNHTLEVPQEGVTFGPAPATWNIAAQLATTCSAPLLACGVAPTVSIRSVPGMKAIEHKLTVTKCINNQL